MLRYESLAVSALQLMKLPHCCEPLRVASSIHLTSQSLTFLESRQSQLVFPEPWGIAGWCFPLQLLRRLLPHFSQKRIFICHSIEIHEIIYIFLNMQPQVRTSQQSFPCTELPFSFHLNPSQSRCTAKAYQVIPAVRVQGTGEHSIAFCIRAFADKKKCLSKWCDSGSLFLSGYWRSGCEVSAVRVCDKVHSKPCPAAIGQLTGIRAVQTELCFVAFCLFWFRESTVACFQLQWGKSVESAGSCANGRRAAAPSHWAH